jgi:hypothetical protein
VDNVVIEFNPEINEKVELNKISLKARPENLVKLPTSSKAQGSILKN